MPSRTICKWEYFISLNNQKLLPCSFCLFASACSSRRSWHCRGCFLFSCNLIFYLIILLVFLLWIPSSSFFIWLLMVFSILLFFTPFIILLRILFFSYLRWIINGLFLIWTIPLLIFFFDQFNLRIPFIKKLLFAFRFIG